MGRTGTGIVDVGLDCRILREEDPKRASLLTVPLGIACGRKNKEERK